MRLPPEAYDALKLSIPRVAHEGAFIFYYLNDELFGHHIYWTFSPGSYALKSDKRIEWFKSDPETGDFFNTLTFTNSVLDFITLYVP
jgi:hypothetical protein